MTALKEFKEDLGLLVEAGLIAIKQGDEESAKKLFNAADLLDPGTTTAKMGHGLIALHKMDIKSAKKHFTEIINKEHSNYRAKAFLAFAHLLSMLQDGSDAEKLEGLKKAAELADEVVQKCDQPSTKELAQSLLEWERELQKGEE
ncbi:MAG: hypothetical protein H7A36_03505 [Chlamydiales bacterium]|nr:hypothetical protein [Chlamydiales bacterium]